VVELHARKALNQVSPTEGKYQNSGKGRQKRASRLGHGGKIAGKI
jgi:hypothetical protein